MSNLPQIYENENFGQIRIITKDDGSYWFVAKDICECLDIRNSRDAINGLDSDEKDGVGITDAIGRSQETTIISEAGMYSLILRSRKPEARAFKRWVTHDVIPSIRKTGSYSVQQNGQIALILEKVGNQLEFLTNKVTDLENQNQQLSIGYNEIKQENCEIKEELKEVKPKAEFYDLVTQNDGQYDFMDVTAVLNGEGYDIGRNQLFELLRNKNILNKNNKPYRRFVRNGMFKRAICGDAVSLKTVATGKGMQFIKKILKRLNNLT